MVERQLPKLNVASSNLVSRSQNANVGVPEAQAFGALFHVRYGEYRYRCNDAGAPGCATHRVTEQDYG